jgi:hypothetical protein
MSQIRRACGPGSVVIDVGLLQHIESAFWLDCAPPASKIARLIEIVERVGRREAERYPALVHAWEAASDCMLLTVDEIYAIQRLRGWHRQQYGNITVDAYWLAEVRNVLDTLTLALGNECDEELAQAKQDGAEWYAEMQARMDRDQGCGDCQWCQALDLRDRCDAILDAAGFHGGSRYRAYSKAA